MKRVALAKSGVAAVADTGFPIVIPKSGDTGRQTCLFYLEGLNFVTKGPDGKYLTAQVNIFYITIMIMFCEVYTKNITVYGN